MLRGVPFEWTFGLWPYWVFVNALLLISYFALDSKMYAKEPAEALAKDAEYATKLGLRGASGLLFLAIIIIAVAFIPSVDLHAIETGHATASDYVPWGEVVMLLSAVTSFLVGDRGARFNLNKFTWTPILEVGALFTWSLRRLVPILVSMVLIFMTGSLWWMLLGVLVGLVILGQAGRDLRAAKTVKAD